MTPRYARMTTLARLTASLSLAVGLLAAAPSLAQVTGEQVAGLAEEGRFAELLEILDQQPADGPAADLVADLELYRDHLAARTDARRAAFDVALEEAQQRIDEDKLEDAMVKLIEAHDLADDPAAFLELERVISLTEAVDERADAAAHDNIWVDALGLYRLLDLLYEDSRRYHDDYLNAASHVRILQLYSPLHLRDLYKERAERLGIEDDPAEVEDEAVEVEDLEDWNIKLAGVTRQHMFQALSQATGRHIDRGGYTELMVGALNGLRTLLETEGLEDAFPGMGSEQRVSALLAEIDDKLEDLARPGRRLTRGTSTELLESILDANTRTVRLPEEVMVYELTTGATGELDPFSTVIWPEDLRQFSRSISGDFVGVGVQIQRLDGKLVVVTPLEGTPGMEAGIKANDIIIRVNGRSTSTWSIDKAVREITGPEGTRVTLTIARPGVDDPIDMTIVRKKIILESIKGWAHRAEGGWDYWVDRESGLGYIRMTQFLRQTADDMDAAVEQMQREGEIKGLILDLRFNPGGLLSTAVEVVDRFVPAGRIVSTVDAEGNETNAQNARRRTTYAGDFPVVLLINRGSASASEIVSGALQDYERAFIIGENSYGKGSVQDIFPLGRGDALFKCTTQHYMLPLGRIIHRTPESEVWGIQPDLAVRMTTTEIADWLEARRDADVIVAAEDVDPDNPRVEPNDILADGMDTQLEAALLYLKAQQLSTSDDAFAQRDE